MMFCLFVFLLLLMLLGETDCHAGGEADQRAEVLRGILRLNFPAKLLRVLGIVVEDRGDAERRT